MVRCVEEVEPVERDAGEHLALVGDVLSQNDVESGDPVARNNQKVIFVHAKDLAYLA
jgi:hypothetical protein